MKKKLLEDVEAAEIIEDVSECSKRKKLLEQLVEEAGDDPALLIMPEENGGFMSFINTGTKENSLISYLLTAATGINHQGLDLKLVLLDCAIYLTKNDEVFAQMLYEVIEETLNKIKEEE